MYLCLLWLVMLICPPVMLFWDNNSFRHFK
jgi:hypothetical protein